MTTASTRIWSREDIAVLKQYWLDPLLQPEEIGAKLGVKRSSQAVMNKALREDLPPRTPGKPRRGASKLSADGQKLPRKVDFWPPEDEALLRRLWHSDELSAAEIGQRMQVKRNGNAVIGKAGRMNLGQKTTRKMNPTWSEADKALLTSLWGVAMSVEMIACHPDMEIKRTRKAVNAQAMRMNLPERPKFKPGRKTVARRPGAFIINRKAVTARAKAIDALREAGADALGHKMPLRPETLLKANPKAARVHHYSGQVITLTALEKRTCRWPIGDPRAESFGFCGGPADGVYCPEHARVAYDPAETTRDTRPLKQYSRSRR